VFPVCRYHEGSHRCCSCDRDTFQRFPQDHETLTPALLPRRNKILWIFGRTPTLLHHDSDLRFFRSILCVATRTETKKRDLMQMILLHPIKPFNNISTSLDSCPCIEKRNVSAVISSGSLQLRRVFNLYRSEFLLLRLHVQCGLFRSRLAIETNASGGRCCALHLNRLSSLSLQSFKKILRS